MRTLIGLLVGALLLTACGNAAEELTEQAIEAGGGGNAEVELDLDDDGEGQVAIETEDGSQTVNIGSGDLPDELEIPVPDGYEVLSSSVLEQADELFVTAAVRYPGVDIDEIIAHFEEYFEGVDGAVNKTESSFDGGRQVLWFSEESGRTVQVLEQDGEGSVGVTVTQQG